VLLPQQSLPSITYSKAGKTTATADNQTMILLDTGAADSNSLLERRYDSS
jgi:hypothetical protein